MDPISPEQLARIVGGSLRTSREPADKARSDDRGPVDSVVIDSRSAAAGTAFFALQGSNHHGALFADKALQNGCSVVVVDEQHASLVSGPSVITADVHSALRRLAAWQRERTPAVLCGITGSVGKTTTRRMVASVLHCCGRTAETPQNYNNDLGVPLSLLELTSAHAFGVFEVAARGPTEIQQLCGLTRPHVGVVTAVSESHLASFGSVEAIEKTKRELVESLPADGTAVLNADDTRVHRMAKSAVCHSVTFGRAGYADFRYELLHSSVENGTVLEVNGCELHVPLFGRHFAPAAAAAVAAATVCGADSQQITEGLKAVRQPPGRCQIRRQDLITLIDDTYNASPASFEAAVRLLESRSDSSRRVLLGADMLDLGSASERLHRQLGSLLAGSRIDLVCFAGEHARLIVDEIAHRSSTRAVAFSTPNDLETALPDLIQAGDTILVKGSRGMKMETVAEAVSRMKV